MHEIESWRREIAPGRFLGGIRSGGEGDPLVMIHGLFDSAESWRDLIEQYPGPCIAIDVPGFGSSSPPPQAHMGSYAETVWQCLDGLSVESCRIVGHSLGGAISSEMAAIDPERVVELNLIAPAGYGRLPLAELANLPLLGGIASGTIRHALHRPRVVRFFYSHGVANGMHPRQDLLDRIADLEPSVDLGVRSALRALARSGGKRGLCYRPGFYSGPVRCGWGTDDLLIGRSHMRNLTRVLPQTELRIWPGVAHHPQAEAPEKVIELLLGKGGKATVALPGQAARISG